MPGHFEEILPTKATLGKYLKEKYLSRPNQHFSFKYFARALFICKLFPKLAKHLDDNCKGNFHQQEWVSYPIIVNTAILQVYLTLTLLVANLVNTTWWQKAEKWLKPWQMGTHLIVLSESFPMNTNKTGLRWFSSFLAFLFIRRKLLPHQKG